MPTNPVRSALLVFTALVILVGVAFVACTYVNSYAGQGYAKQTEIDPNVYRLNNADGELVTFVHVTSYPGKTLLGKRPLNGQYTYTWRFEIVDRGSLIILHYIEVIVPTNRRH